MAYQLIYTSYHTSLVQGRSGFSTVARSQAMPERLVAEIERVSQYDIRSGEVFSHRIISVQTQIYHVLTRIKDSGVDYTNRNNYIAHHLILSDMEVSAISANPAEVMLGFDGWANSFEGQPRFIEDIDVSVLDKSILSLPAKNWQIYFGDSAYASVLGNNAKIYANVDDAEILLRLYGESLMLLKHKNGDWSKTFTTHILPVDRFTDFNWSAGNSFTSQDAEIDLVNKYTALVPAGRASEYARTGVATNAEKLNLSVRKSVSRKSYNVVDVDKKSYMPIYVGSVVSVVILLVALVYFFS